MFNKTRFDHAVREYQKNLTRKGLSIAYKWEALEIFQNNWNEDVMDFHSMYDTAIDESTDPWSDPITAAKHTMLFFIRQNEDLVRTMFRDLYNDKKDLEGRIGRFLHHCDILLEEAGDEEQFDHHHDKYIVSLYLSFRYPEKYCGWKYAAFEKTMENLKSPAIPSIHEIDRYFKIMRLFQKFLWEDSAIKMIYLSLITEDGLYKGTTLFLAQDFCQFCAGLKPT